MFKRRLRGYDDSSIILTKTKNGVKIETLVKGGKTFCHLPNNKAIELGEALLEASKKEQ